MAKILRVVAGLVAGLAAGEEYQFWQAPYRPPFCASCDVPVRPDSSGAKIACPVPPLTDNSAVAYGTLTGVEAVLPLYTASVIEKGLKPNPEAVPLCEKWLSTQTSVVNSRTCQTRCTELAQACGTLTEQWVYRKWLSESVEDHVASDTGNGLYDCVRAAFKAAELTVCAGPCANQAAQEVPCVIAINQCYSNDDPRRTTDSTSTEASTDVPPTTTTTPDPPTTEEDATEITWEIGIVGGAMASGVAIAAVAGACCYCKSASDATQGLQDFGDQIGDGLDDAERMFSKHKVTRETMKDQEDILKEELALRAFHEQARGVH